MLQTMQLSLSATPRRAITEIPKTNGERTLNARAMKFSICTAALLALPCTGSAFEFTTGNEDLTLRWDNTVKYSTAYRLKNPSDALTSAAANSNNVNQDDGDRNFNRGLISNRFDLLTEFDATYKNFGARFSGAAWYDTVYNRDNDNPGFGGGAYPNQTSVPFNRFVEETRKIHGRSAELLDAFVFGNFELDDTSRASVRLGRHGMVWGETLFFGSNGIAGGMMPVDVVKLASVPNTQFKEAIRPVPMLSGQWQLNSETTIGSYYQFSWAKSRIPTVGSYFSAGDASPDGGEQILLAGQGSPFLANAARLDDQKPKRSGQGGLQLRTKVSDYDLGAYLIRFHSKTPQPVVKVGAAPVTFVPGAGCAIPGSFSTGSSACGLAAPVGYRLAYGEGITSFGLSANKTFGALNLATEVSLRKNQPLSSGLTSDTSALTGGNPTDNAGNPAYPVGRTAHVNVAAIWSIDPNPLFREGSLVAEIGWNRLLSVTRNPQLLDPNSTRDAVALRGVFQPTYRQVVAGLDVAPQLGVGWAPKGSRSAITAAEMPQNGNGDVTFGVDLTYQDAWRASLAITHYFGGGGGFLVSGAGGNSSIGYKQYYRDRDFVSLSIRRTF